MKNRLQFNRHYALFHSREEALAALRARITDPGFIPLIGEPMVFRYEDENHTAQVILAIGKKAGNSLDERDYHVIDTANLDKKIADEIAARETLDEETIKRIVFDGVVSTFEDNVATLSVSANSIPIGQYEEYSGRANTPHPIHDDYSVLEAVKQVDTNFVSFLNDTEAKVNGLHIVKVTEGLDANVMVAYDLVNVSGNVQPNSERILIYKDSSLYDVYLGHTDDRLNDYSSPVVTPGTGDTALCFIYLKSDGKYQLVAVNVENFLQENEFEDGLAVNNHVVKVKIDNTSEGFLTVGLNGVKLSGVQQAINAAQQAEEDRAVAVEGTIQSELDSTQVGAGLASDGSYIHDHPTYYIDEATSLANADHLLDAALNTEAGRAISAEGVLQGNIDAEETRAMAAENALSSGISAEEARATEAENVLQGQIDSEADTRAVADEALQGELDSTQVGAGLNSDGTYHKHNTPGDMGHYIADANSLDSAIVLLDGTLYELSAATANVAGYINRRINSLSAGTVNDITALSAGTVSLSGKVNELSAGTVSLSGKVNELSAGTVNEIETLNGKVDGFSAGTISEVAALNDKISELSAGTVNDVTVLSAGTVSEIASINGKVNELSAGTVSELNTLNGKINEETQKISELSGATMAFSSATVSEIARIDATATRNKVKSTGNTIVVAEAVEGTNLEANIDGKTILSNGGQLKTGLKVAALAPGELESNVREAFRLVDNEGTPVDNTIVKIYKSTSLVSIELINISGTDYVRVTYIDNSGQTQTMDLNIQQLVFEAEFKDGLSVNGNHEVKVKVDPTSEVINGNSVLSVSAEGVKLSGIQSAINSAVTAETQRATAAENAIGVNVTTLSAATIGGLNAISAVTDNIISACGLNIGQQGGYNPHSNTHIINGAGSLDQADVLLDDALWTLSGYVATISGGSGGGGDVRELEEKVRQLSGATVSIADHMTGEYIPLNNYEISSDRGQALIVDSGDTVNEAFGKLQKQILEDEEVVAAGFNSLNDKIDSSSAATSGVLTINFNNVEQGQYSPSASTTIDIEATGADVLLAGYEISSENEEALIVESADTVNEAFGKLQKQILDNEEAIAAGFNNLNDRIGSSSAMTSGVLTFNFNGTEQGKYSPSANTIIDVEATGDEVLLTGYEISSDSGEALIVESADTVSEAFGKVQKQILDDEETVAASINSLNDKIDASSAKTSGVLTFSFNGTEQGEYSPSANTAIDIEAIGGDILLTDYEISTESEEALIVESADTVSSAFGKLQKQILDNEEAIAAGLNDLNNRIDTTSGADALLAGYEIASGRGAELAIESADTVCEAFGKIQKQIYDNELVAAGAFNAVNDNIVSLSGDMATLSDDVASIISAATASSPFITSVGNRSAVLANSNNIAYGSYAVAEGNTTIASGNSSHAEGIGTTAKGLASHAEGQDGEASGKWSHSEGGYTFARGDRSHAEGNTTYAEGENTHAEGINTHAYGINSHTEGADTIAGDANNINDSGETGYGWNSHAEGNSSVAKGSTSHAEGFHTTANDFATHSEGEYSEARGNVSHAEGSHTKALGNKSHAEGNYAEAHGPGSHAGGNSCKAYGQFSFATGNITVASGETSFAIGGGTIANNMSEFAAGRRNKSNKASDAWGNSGNTILSVGIGTSDSNRANAFEVMQNGDAYLYGVGNYNGTNPSSSKTVKEVLSSVTISINELSGAISTESAITQSVNELSGVVLSNESATTQAVSELNERVDDVASELSNFRGWFEDLTLVQRKDSDERGYAKDSSGSKIPHDNDYIFVEDCHIGQFDSQRDAPYFPGDLVSYGLYDASTDSFVGSGVFRCKLQTPSTPVAPTNDESDPYWERVPNYDILLSGADMRWMFVYYDETGWKPVNAFNKGFTYASIEEIDALFSEDEGGDS